MVVYPRPNETKHCRFGFSRQWALLGTIFNNIGQKVLLRDYSVDNFDQSQFILLLHRENVQLVLIEFDSFTIKRSENCKHANEIIRLVRTYCPYIKIVAYGHYCCITARDIPSADSTAHTDELNNILSAAHASLPKQFQRISFESCDDLPYIDRILLYEQVEFFQRHRRSTLVQTSYGCENTCTFCHRQSYRKKFIFHSDNYVFSEFEMLCSQEFANVWITDDNFAFNLPRAKRILRACA